MRHSPIIGIVGFLLVLTVEVVSSASVAAQSNSDTGQSDTTQSNTAQQPTKTPASSLTDSNSATDQEWVEADGGVVDVIETEQTSSDPMHTADRTTITRQQFEGKHENVYQVLETAPGVTITRSGGGMLSPVGISLRGSAGNQVQIIIDGIPIQNDAPLQALGDAHTSGVDLSQIPLEQIEKIEIVPGPQGGTGALGGVIRITTGQPKTSSLKFTTKVGSSDYRSVSAFWSTQFEEQTLSLFVQQQKSSGRYVFYDQKYRGDEIKQWTCRRPVRTHYFERLCNRAQTEHFQLNWRPWPNHLHQLKWNRLQRHGLGNIALPRPQGFLERQRITWQWKRQGQEQGESQHSNRESEELKEKNIETPNTENIAPAPLRDTSRTTSASGLPMALPQVDSEAASISDPWSWGLFSSHLSGKRHENTTAGSQSSLYNAYTIQQSKAHLQYQTDFQQHLVLANWTVGRETLKDKRFQKHRSLHEVQLKWAHHARNVDGGGSTVETAVHWSKTGKLEDYLAVNGSAAWQSQTGWGIKNSIGTGYRPPTLYELYDPGYSALPSAANPQLMPEYSKAWDTSLFYQHASMLDLSLTHFQQQIRDHIIAVKSAKNQGYYRLENVFLVKSKGIELKGKLNLANWYLQSSYTQLESRLFENDSEDKRYNNNWVPGKPRRSRIITSGWREDGWKMFITQRLKTRRFLDKSNVYYVTGYKVWDVGMSMMLGTAWQINTNVYNATNTTYAERDNAPMPGTQWVVSISFKQ